MMTLSSTPPVHRQEPPFTVSGMGVLQTLTSAALHEGLCANSSGGMGLDHLSIIRSMVTVPSGTLIYFMNFILSSNLYHNVKELCDWWRWRNRTAGSSRLFRGLSDSLFHVQGCHFVPCFFLHEGRVKKNSRQSRPFPLQKFFPKVLEVSCNFAKFATGIKM